jgi:hypothetical protein
MVYGNTAIVFMVISVVACVMGLVFVGMYYLNKAVNQSPRLGAGGHNDQGG